MTFGKPDSESARVKSVEAVGEILDVFQAHGHVEVCHQLFLYLPDLTVLQVDTARVYTNGTSEELLGELGWQKRGLVVETKFYPYGSVKHTSEVRPVLITVLIEVCLTMSYRR